MNSIRFGRWALLAVTILATTSVRSAGGPDGFGFVWDANSDVGGPALEWIDISALGTPVTGLADDNSAAVIALFSAANTRPSTPTLRATRPSAPST